MATTDEVVHELRKAIKCLFLSVDESIATDVRKKAEAVITMIAPTTGDAHAYHESSIVFSCRECGKDATDPIHTTGDAVSREAVMGLVSALLIPLGESLDDPAAENFGNGVRHAGKFLQEQVSRLPALPGGVDGWQPIASAPKDGDDVLLWLPSENDAPSCCYEWRDDKPHGWRLFIVCGHCDHEHHEGELWIA